MPTNEATELQPLLAAITIMGSGRLGPTLTALIGAAGTIIGALALIRARRSTRSDTHADTTSGQRGANTALVLGAISLVLGGVLLAATDSGPGTGNGVVASVMAVVLGPIALVLGGLARARRRSTSPISHV